MFSYFFNTKKSSSNFSSRQSSVRLHGILVGLVPSASLVVSVVVTLASTLIGRQLASPLGFLMQQQLELATLGAGGIMTSVTLVAAILFSIRRITIWRQRNAIEQARNAMWALDCTILIILLPLLLAVILPQYPAP